MVSQRVLCRRFIGRAAELEHLAARRRAAGESRGGAVLVLGEAGIGKSRLVQEFRRRFGGGRSTLVTATCREFGQRPLEPLAALLAQLDRSVSHPLDGAAASKVEQTAAILGAFERSAWRQTTTVVVEDIHWAQAELMQMLAIVAERAANRRLLLIATCRDADVEPSGTTFTGFARLMREPSLSVLRLEPLGGTDLSDLLQGALGDSGASVPAQTLDNVRRRSGGNPLFAEELLRHAVDQRRAAARSLRLPALPISLQGVIRERLRRCAPAERALLDAASVFGLRFRVDLLAEFSAPAQADVSEALRRLLDLQLVVPVEHEPRAYEFRHALTRDVVYGDLPAPEAHALHRRIAESIETRPDANAHVELLAHSFWEAGMVERAAPYCEGAGDAAVAQFADEEAALWYERAASGSRGNPADVGRVLGKAAEAIARLSDLERAIPLFRRAIDALVESGNLALAVRAGCNFAGTLFNASRVSQAHSVLDDTLRLALASPEVALEQSVLVRKAALHMAMRETDAAWTHLDAVAEPALPPASVTSVEYYLMKSGLHAQRGELAAWNATFPGALDALRRGKHHPMVERHAHMTIAIDALALGETAAARAHAKIALEVARRIRTGEAHTLTLLVEIEQRSGNLRSALEHLRAIVPVEEYLVRQARALVATKLALALGDDDLLRASLDTGLLDETRNGGHEFAKVQVLGPFAAGMARLGRRDEALELAERACAMISMPYEIAWEIVNLALLVPHRAEQLRRRVNPEAVAPAGRVNAAVDAVLHALAAREAGAAEASLAAARAAAELFAAIGWPILEAQCRELAGERGAALAIYMRLGCVADARRLELAAPASGASGAAPLSPRERQVARLVATGKNNREVAQELSLSVKAIERYLTSAYQKLGIRSRSQLAAFIAAGERSTS